MHSNFGIPVSFTTTIEDFIAHDSLKMSYTRQPLSNEIFIRSHELLFEQGLSDLDIKVYLGKTQNAFLVQEIKVHYHLIFLQLLFIY